jgi:hypothetical protein
VGDGYGKSDLNGGCDARTKNGREKSSCELDGQVISGVEKNLPL